MWPSSSFPFNKIYYSKKKKKKKTESFKKKLKTLINFWRRQGLNLKYFIQLLEILPVKLIEIYKKI